MITQLVEDYFVQKALYSNEFLGSWTYGLINKNNNYTNLLLTGYESKQVKTSLLVKIDEGEDFCD